MPARDAFIFSAVTGAGYLSNPILPFSPKGLLKLFYNAFDYKFVTGIFENTSLKYTPYYLSQAKPFLFDSDYKFMVPVEFYSEQELQDLLVEHFDSLAIPTDYVILRIEKAKEGNGMESFMEYLAADFFRKRGFIVENQIPLAHSLGSPDFGGYQLLDIINNFQPFIGIGFHIIELAMIRLGQYTLGTTNCPRARESCIVGEAKTGTSIMTKQLIKYLNTGLFDFGFEIHPSKMSPARDEWGLLTIDSDTKVVFHPPKSTYSGPKSHSKSEYHHWLTNYMKFYLIANLSNDEFNEYYQETRGSRISRQQDIVDFVCSQSVNEVIAKLEEVL